MHKLRNRPPHPRRLPGIPIPRHRMVLMHEPIDGEFDDFGPWEADPFALALGSRGLDSSSDPDAR